MPAGKPELDAVLSLDELEELAKPRMSAMAYAYVAGGAADELTLCANCDDWKRIRLAPRVLVDVSRIVLQTEILGQKFEFPILLAPAAFHRLCHAEGELATVAGANESDASIVL